MVNQPTQRSEENFSFALIIHDTSISCVVFDVHSLDRENVNTFTTNIVNEVLISSEQVGEMGHMRRCFFVHISISDVMSSEQE